MNKEFYINNNKCIINFTKTICSNEIEILMSKQFRKFVTHFLKLNEDLALIQRINYYFNNEKIEEKIILIFNELYHGNKNLTNIDFVEDIVDLIEMLYDYWRKLERYAIYNYEIEESSKLSRLIINLYRKIEENLKGKKHRVYRETNSGMTSKIYIDEYKSVIPEDYKYLNKVSFITKIILKTPYIIETQSNKREGIFKELKSNPFDIININYSHFLCIPINVGKKIAFIYFHRNYMNHGISLSNLFRVLTIEELKNKKPDIILLFGINNNEFDNSFYDDIGNDLLIGFISKNKKNDYFGYMKKMILTMHNIITLNEKNLPIHGAMVHIILKNNTQKNIIIIGDSGAGKSESLEAFRQLAKEYLKEIKIIYDDMGYISLKNDELKSYGTEIGGFIRLDDLDVGYSFEVLDRAILMNTSKKNARILIPLTKYYTITKGFVPDLILYANNYIDTSISLEILKNKEEFKKTLIEGKRMAKGTTKEYGIVTSFFANPFGPYQRKNQTTILLDNFIDFIYTNNIPCGILYTKLGVEGNERKGPLNAAKELLNWIK